MKGEREIASCLCWISCSHQLFFRPQVKAMFVVTGVLPKKTGPSLLGYPSLPRPLWRMIALVTALHPD